MVRFSDFNKALSFDSSRKHYNLLYTRKMVSHFDTLFLLFLLLFTGLCFNSTTFLNIIIIAEMIWIVLFMMSLVTGQYFDNLSILALTFFLLVIVACEMSQGLVLLTYKYSLDRSTTFFDTDKSKQKLTSKRHKQFFKK